jgi:hypothetical protein
VSNSLQFCAVMINAGACAMVAAMLVTTAIAGKPAFISVPRSAEVMFVHQNYSRMLLRIVGQMTERHYDYGQNQPGQRAVLVVNDGLPRSQLAVP